MSVELKAANKDLLAEAAKEMHLPVYNYGKDVAYGPILIRGDMAQVSDRDLPLLNRLKVEYSKKVVMKAAKAKGWTGTWMRNKENPTVQLRRY